MLFRACWSWGWKCLATYWSWALEQTGFLFFWNIWTNSSKKRNQTFSAMKLRTSQDRHGLLHFMLLQHLGHRLLGRGGWGDRGGGPPLCLGGPSHVHGHALWGWLAHLPDLRAGGEHGEIGRFLEVEYYIYNITYIYTVYIIYTHHHTHMYVYIYIY